MVLKVEPLKVENERIFGSFGVHSFFSFSFFAFWLVHWIEALLHEEYD